MVKRILSVIVLSVTMGTLPASADVFSLIAAVPTYEFRKVTMVDENGTALTNEDGTTQVRVLIYQTNGDSTIVVSCDYAKRSIEKVFNSKLVKSISMMARGLDFIVALPLPVIITIEKACKTLAKFNRQLKVYEENFSEDGTLLDASADLDKLKIVLSETEDTGTPDGVAEMIASSNNAEEPDLDALLAAAFW